MSDHVPPRGLARREALLLGIGAFGVVAVPFLRGKRRVWRRTAPVMGTLADVAVVHAHPAYAHTAIAAALDELRRVERLLTRFAATSDVGRINAAADEAVPVTGETAGVLRRALAWAEASDGVFDPCLGAASVLWDVGHRTAPPASEQVRGLAGRRFYRTLDVDAWAGRPAVRRGDPEALVDLGGIAKGYGVDRAVAVLRAWGIRDGLVNVGGDLYALGTSPEGDPWRVGVRSPAVPDRIVEHFPLTDGAAATSGDYLQYFDFAGRRYHHLLDPRTGGPVRGATHSITVTAPDTLTADAAATAAFALGPGRATAALARAAPGARIVSRA